MNWLELILSCGVTFLATLATGAMAWQKIKDRSDENSRRIEALEADSICNERLARQLDVLANDIKWIKKNPRLSRSHGDDRQDDSGDGGD